MSFSVFKILVKDSGACSPLNKKGGNLMEALAKFVISQILGIGAAIVTHLICQDIAGTTPIVIPATAWITTSIATILKI
jgi:hypothetical protein